MTIARGRGSPRDHGAHREIATPTHPREWDTMLWFILSCTFPHALVSAAALPADTWFVVEMKT